MKLPEWMGRWQAPGEAPVTGLRRFATLGWMLGLILPMLGFMLLMLPFYDTSPWEPVAVVLGFGTAVLLRRRVPVVAFLVVVTLACWVATYATDAAPPWMSFGVIALLILSYLIGRADDSRVSWLTQLAAMFGLVIVLAPLLDIKLVEGVNLTLVLVFNVVFPWLVGRYRHQHAQLIAAGWQRAEQLEREQRAVAEQARLRERTRIAEDMHDSLGHELSLIALRSAVLEVDASLPERHQAAAGQLRRSAAVATERLREIIGLLRDETESASVTPVDEPVGDLIERARDSGMDVTLNSTGDPAELPRMADRAVYRVVQEALTNAAKHAPGQAVAIAVTITETTAEVSVRNDLPRTVDPAVVSGGRGLVGLTERVRLAGGTLHAGAADDNFEVVAQLPRSGEVTAEADRDTTESAQQHVQVRRQTRRRLIATFAIPAVLLAGLGFVSVVVYLVGSSYSVLPKADFEALEVGQSRESVDEVLPAFEMLEPPEFVGEPAELPESAVCHYYPSQMEGETFVDVYQLCYVDEKLASKAVITKEQREADYENRHGR